MRGPIMGSLKSPCTTSYRSSIETIPLNCLLFEKIAFFGILTTDRQTNGQTDEHHRCVKASSRSLAVASYGLIILALLLSEISWLAFRTPLKTDRMHHSIRGVKITHTSWRCDKIGLPVEGLMKISLKKLAVRRPTTHYIIIYRRCIVSVMSLMYFTLFAKHIMCMYMRDVEFANAIFAARCYA